MNKLIIPGRDIKRFSNAWLRSTYMIGKLIDHGAVTRSPALELRGNLGQVCTANKILWSINDANNSYTFTWD